MNEVNFFHPKYAAKTDLRLGGETNFVKGIYYTMALGRTLISEAPNGYLPAVKELAQIAISNWEQLYVANTIHYINKTVSEYRQYGSEAYLFQDFTKYWGELKGFAMAMQFNPNSVLSAKAFSNIHGLIGDKPVLPHANNAAVDIYINDLMSVRETLGKAYGFSKILQEKL